VGSGEGESEGGGLDEGMEGTGREDKSWMQLRI